MTIEKKNIKIAAVQDAPLFLDKERTVEQAINHITSAADAGAGLIVFPEAYISGYPDWVWTVPPADKKQISELYSELLSNAVAVGDETCRLLCEAASEAKMHVVIGVNEVNVESSRSSLFNAMMYIDEKGELLGVHRKLIPTGGERLMWASGSADRLVSFDTSLGQLGGLICWENYMPLARTAMYQNGVQLYCAPTWDSSESWLTAMRHIAREGGMFVFGCCQAVHRDDIPDRYEFKKNYPAEREWINKGNSCIVNPMGQVVSGPLAEDKGILYAEIDLNEITDQKWLFDVAGHYARDDVFTFKVNK